MEEKKRTVYFYTAIETNNMDAFKDLYPDKKFIIRYDPSLFAGVRIIDNDDVFNLNLQQRFHDIIEHIEK
jgi:hypothetical protein